MVVLYDPDNPLVASRTARGAGVQTAGRHRGADQGRPAPGEGHGQLRPHRRAGAGRRPGDRADTRGREIHFYRGARIGASNINPDTWVRWPINGAPATINIAADLGAGRSWRGVQADLPAIAAHADAVGQIYAHGTALSVVERVQAYEWVDLVNEAGRELVLLAVTAQTATSGVDSLAFPSEFGDYDNYEIIVGSDTNVTQILRGRTSWLAAQTDTITPLKLGALDEDEAGTRQWLEWTVATRTWAFGAQTSTLNLKIQSARLYDDAGKKGEKGDPGGRADSRMVHSDNVNIAALYVLHSTGWVIPETGDFYAITRDNEATGIIDLPRGLLRRLPVLSAGDVVVDADAACVGLTARNTSGIVIVLLAKAANQELLLASNNRLLDPLPLEIWER